MKELTKEKGSRDYSLIVSSTKFQELLKQKNRFILPMSLFFFSFYFLLPILTSYSSILNTPAFGSITWAWVFAFAQFLMTWSLCILYSKKAENFDNMVAEIIKEHK